MRKILLFLGFCVGVFGTQISQQEASLWLKDTNLTCQKFHIDTSKHPEFRAFIELNDDKKLVFSSTKAMFAYFYENSKEFGANGVKQLLVTDFFSGDILSASEAFYVFGSTIMSAKGDDLIPFSRLADTQKFMQERKGHKILEFSKITKRLIDYLR